MFTIGLCSYDVTSLLNYRIKFALEVYIDSSYSSGLNALRLLRNEVISVHRRIVENNWEVDPADSEKTLEERLDFINQIYDNLESHAKQLPTSTPMTVQMERLSRFLHDGQIDPHINELYDKALEASTWMETNNQLLQMYAEFLRTVVGNRRRSIMTDRPISYSNYGLTSSPQSIFEQTLTVVLKDPNIKKIGLVGRYLEKSTLSAIVEFKFGQVVDKQYVCLLKMLMVVNSGLPEFVQMIAPHEDWSYLDVGFAQVDIHKESRYLVYRKMSVQANIHLMQTIMPCIDIRNAHTLSYVLNLFAKFSGVFDIKCRVCKAEEYLRPYIEYPLFSVKNQYFQKNNERLSAPTDVRSSMSEECIARIVSIIIHLKKVNEAIFANLRSAVAQLDQRNPENLRTVKIEGAERVTVDSSALHCPICFCIFPSVPFILKCGHSFCQKCVRKLVENSCFEHGTVSEKHTCTRNAHATAKDDIFITLRPLDFTVPVHYDFNQVFECPICRQVTSSGIYFTKNYLVNALLQSICEISQDEKEDSVNSNLRLSYQLISRKFLEEQEKNKILRRKYEEERLRSRRYLVLLLMESALLLGFASLYKLLFS
ncbi:BMA-CYP-43A1 [Dirofilaria immitis]|nr:BMA-CYP-43A1 [Dirofilaria immitis]